MNRVNDNGLKVAYPEHLKLDLFMGQRLIFTLKKPKTKNMLTFNLENEGWTFDHVCHIRLYNPENAKHELEGFEVLRLGDYETFPGAKTSFYKRLSNTTPLTFVYVWTIVIPFENKITSVAVIAGSLDEIDQIWKSVVDSIEFQPSKYKIITQPSTQLSPKLYNWTKRSILKKSKHFKHLFQPSFGFIAFYDSSVEYDSSILLDLEDNDASTGVMKKTGQMTVLTRDLLKVTADFYFSADSDQIENPKYDHIIDGIINIDSGKMVIDDGDSVEVEVLMKGRFKFRIYFGPVNFDNELLCMKIYFWATEEQENNEIKIIKKSSKLFPVTSHV